MQEENRCTQRKTCGTMFGLETNWTYSTGGVEPGLCDPRHRGSTDTLRGFPKSFALLIFRFILAFLFRITLTQPIKVLW